MLNSEKMIAALSRQDLAHAKKYLRRALQEDPSEDLLSLANYLENIGFYPQAKEIYLQIKEDYPEVGINLAQIASEDGDIDEAFLYLESFTPDSEWYVLALLTKADLYQMEGLADVAREKLEEAVTLSDDPFVIFGLGEINLELGEFKQAIDCYAQLDNREILASTGVSTYQRIGLAYASMGRFETAIEFLEKAVELDYDDQTVFELATLLYEQEDYQRANLYFKQIDTINPDFEGYEYLYAQALHAEHATKEALTMVQKGLSKNSFDVQLYLLASQLSYELHDVTESEAYLKKALPFAEDKEDIFLRLSNLYLEEERFDDVIALLEQEDIESILTQWNLAKAHRSLEQDDQALPIYQEIAQHLSHNPEFLLDYGYYLREVGDSEGALEVLKRYLEMVPDDGQVVDFVESLESHQKE